MADTWSLFDVIGPVMIGPSSSHTAGAAKLGKMARIIFGEEPEEVILHLHGSFATVYNGHCTDKALMAGLLKMSSGDDRLSKSIEIAKKQGIKVQLATVNLGPNEHPNTVVFELKKGNRTMMIQGSSIGGGKARITKIDKVPIKLQGEHSLLLIMHETNKVNVIDIINIVGKSLQIVDIKTATYKQRSLWDIEIKEWFEGDMMKEIEKLPGVMWARYINHESHYEY